MAAQMNILIPQAVGLDFPQKAAMKPRITGMNPNNAPNANPESPATPAPIHAPQALAHKMLGNEMNAPMMPRIIGALEVPLLANKIPP